MNKSTLLACILLVCPSVWGHGAEIDRDGMTVVDGKRTFILGLYENVEDESFAQEVARAGFNLVRAKPSKESLDLAHAHGLQCWIPLSGIAVSSAEEEARLQSLVNSFKQHPALAVWEGPDETLWNVWWRRWNQAISRWNVVEGAMKKVDKQSSDYDELKNLYNTWRRYRHSARYAQAEEVENRLRSLLGLPPADGKLSEWNKHLDPLFEQLRRGTRIVRKTDPHHVIWFNHAPRNSMKDLKRFGKVADVVGCDIYPVPFGPNVGHSDLAERNLACVGRYTQRMAQSAPTKPVWMVLQGFGWDDIGEGTRDTPRPRPTYDQTRFMAYDAIVNGARGILYWGTFAIEKDSQLWADIKKVISELSELQLFLTAEDATNRVRLEMHASSGSGEKGIVLLAKNVERRWAFFVVNEADHPIAFDISGLSHLNGRSLNVLDEPETLEVKDGRITYGLPARSVSVLLMEGYAQ